MIFLNFKTCSCLLGDLFLTPRNQFTYFNIQFKVNKDSKRNIGEAELTLQLKQMDVSAVDMEVFSQSKVSCISSVPLVYIHIVFVQDDLLRAMVAEVGNVPGKLELVAEKYNKMLAGSNIDVVLLPHQVMKRAYQQG